MSVQETGGTTVPTFADLGLPVAVVTTLADQGITRPFPIQTATLPGAGDSAALGMTIEKRQKAEQTMPLDTV